MVFMIIIPFLNGYFIGNINPTFSDKPMLNHGWHIRDVFCSRAARHDAVTRQDELALKIALERGKQAELSAQVGSAIEISTMKHSGKLT